MSDATKPATKIYDDSIVTETAPKVRKFREHFADRLKR
jgi:hypothetical protein